MSSENVRKMFKKVQSDQKFRDEFNAAMNDHKSVAEALVAENIIAFGISRGFEFSSEDLFAARAEFLDRANANRELSAGELEMVAGGSKFDAVVMSAATFGILCLVMSLDNPSAEGRDCGITLPESSGRPPK